jgi:hypothetical protein
MTPRQRAALRAEADPPEDPLGPAVDAYRDRFGAGALPHLFLPAWTVPTAARVLRLAVARGRPVRGWTVARCCGIRQPPDGVML